MSSSVKRRFSTSSRQIGGTAHHGVRAAKGMVTVERGKAVLLVELAALPKALSHRELVEVGEKRHVGGMGGVSECHERLPFPG